jgi:hypothetical protein
MLYANAPEASGVDVQYMSSPVVTLGRYDGQFTDSNAPAWTHLPPGVTVELRQPGTAVAAVFAELAFWPENCAPVRRLVFSFFLYFNLICRLVTYQS